MRSGITRHVQPGLALLLVVLTSMMGGNGVTYAATAPAIPPDAMAWTLWNPSEQALADDGSAIWIGASGGVVRWDKATARYRRYGMPDGLPHRRVLAVAVDSGGVLWFGGDAGLSRLDPAEQWTHFNTANSGLYSNYVDGIAVGPDDTLWLSHGLPGGSVTRRDPDGTWHWYPDRETVAGMQYDQVRQTRNINPLWTVAGAEIWVGYAVYDGTAWHDRTPAGELQPPSVLATDSTGKAYALSGRVVHRWDGSAWSDVPLGYLSFNSYLTTLAIGPDDTVWVGGLFRDFPYAALRGFVGRLESGPEELLLAGPVTALLPEAGSSWAIGPGWLMAPGGTLSSFPDTPTFADVGAAIADVNGIVWVHSTYPEGLIGSLDALDDEGTSKLGDDLWEPMGQEQPALDILTAAERAPGGDIWVAGGAYARLYWPAGPFRWHEGRWTDYDRSSAGLTDIFAQDDRHTWFVTRSGYLPFSFEDAVLALDDGGTPADLADDVWSTFPITTTGTGGVVAVDSSNRPWFGDSSGLYRWDGAAWQFVDREFYSQDAVCDLAMAADGTLFVQLGAHNSEAGCNDPYQYVGIIWPDGRWQTSWVDDLVSEHLEIVASARNRNRMWAVAPDGAAWYTIKNYWDDGSDTADELHRVDRTGVTVYQIPFDRKSIRSLDVGRRQRVWIAAGSDLWRFAPLADLRSTWLPAIQR